MKVKEVIAMPWNMQDYPNSLKNFDPLLRKKMIDMANALLAEGHDEEAAIRIAISQTKKWYDEATPSDLEALKQEPNPSKSDTHETTSNPDLFDEDVTVFFEENQWKVKTQKAERASNRFATKKEAVRRAREIAQNKESKVMIYTKEGKKQS